MNEILVKTLSRVALMNIELRKFSEAHSAVQDLEYLNTKDANTFLIKLKLVVLENNTQDI